MTDLNNARFYMQVNYSLFVGGAKCLLFLLSGNLGVCLLDDILAFSYIGALIATILYSVMQIGEEFIGHRMLPLVGRSSVKPQVVGVTLNLQDLKYCRTVIDRPSARGAICWTRF
jgi:hypothetical protein